MNIQEYETISDKAVNHLTNNGSKSRSVNSLYKMSNKILYQFIIEKGGFTFDEVLDWIKINRYIWYKAKFKAIKRLAFSIYDYELNGCFTSDKFIYFTTNELILYVKDDEANLINEFITKNKYKGNYCGHIRNILAHYFLYLRDKNIHLDRLTLFDYEELYYYFKTTFPKKYFERSVGLIKRFMDFYKENFHKSQNMSFLLYKKTINHLQYLRSKLIKDDIIPLTDDAGSTFSQDFFCNSYVNSFIAVMREYNYSKKKIEHMKCQLNLFHLFLHLIDYKYSPRIIEYWTDNIIKPISKGYLSYRNTVLRYINYIQDKLNSQEINLKFTKFNIEKIYLRKNNFDNSLPLWSKNVVLEYFNYRKRTGCVESTINNDRSSILKLCLYLDNAGITQFNKISPNILMHYNKNEKHKSLNGKNNYIGRVRSFIRYLQDLSIVPLFDLSTVLEGCRVTQKVIITLPDNMVEKLYNLKYKLQTNVEYRAYAIFMLGLRLGIRSYDIANLKFENVSFKNMTIRFIQSKTQKFIELPMPTDVANAIYNYVKIVRPNHDSEYIFIGRYAPYVKISRSVCRADLKRLILLAGYTTTDVGGFHILRRTYASNLLKMKRNINEVALALGHSTNVTVDKYLNINKEYGYLCPLELDLIPYGGKNL